MVNTGKPSGACINCRERRIKCDEAKPGCVKCLKSGRTCAGYSQGFKLRDQTQKTIIKAKFGKGGKAKRLAALKEHKATTTSPKSAGPSSESSPALDLQDTQPRRSSVPAQNGVTHGGSGAPGGHSRNLSDPTVKARRGLTSPLTASDIDANLSGVMGLDLQAIHTPLVDRARCYFLSSYVVYCPNKSDTGMLTFIPSLLASADGSTRYFQDMFSAVSIAAFSMRPNCKDAASATHLYYGAGVRGLREALQVKETARSDTVLATTILLGVYEVRVRQRPAERDLLNQNADEKRTQRGSRTETPTRSHIRNISELPSSYCVSEGRSNSLPSMAPRCLIWSWRVWYVYSTSNSLGKSG